MSDSADFHALPSDFSGRVRLFPLPNLVMFPGVMQPLHLFESRYLEMMEDTLANDMLIAMSLLKPGWEPDYETRPPLFETITIGRVVSHTQDDEGCYNLLLLGVQRAMIVEELPAERAFREAKVQLLEDQYPPSTADERGQMQRRLLSSFRATAPAESTAGDQIEQLLGSEISLGMLADIVAFSSPLPLAVKQQLLTEVNVDRRAHQLLTALDELTRNQPPRRPFPPEVSDN